MKKIALIITCIVIFCTITPAKDTPLLNGSIGVPALNFWWIKFPVADGNSIQGWFRVADHDINCMIMDEQNFDLFKKGYDPFVIYASGRVTAANIPRKRPRPGIYYLVFDNKYSLITPKTVNGVIVLQD